MVRSSNSDGGAADQRRRALETELAELERRLRRYRDGADEGGEDEPWPPPADPALRRALSEASEERAELLRAALRHLDEGRHGRCRGCEREIAPARLAAMPWTTTCSDCGDDP